MTTPTITPEERERWKREADTYGHTGKDIRISRLCDALEAAEARASISENELAYLREINGTDRYDEVVSDLIDCTRQAEVRAEEAERQRDRLAGEISRKTCPDIAFVVSGPNNCGKGTCEAYWIEWAAQKDGE